MFCASDTHALTMTDEEVAVSLAFRFGCSVESVTGPCMFFFFFS